MSTSFPPPPLEDPVNPYAAPATNISSEPTGLAADGDLAEAEAVRRVHIGHEESVRSLGSLHYLGAIFGVIALGAMLLTRSWNMLEEPGDSMLFGGIVVFYALATALNFALGYGLRGLKPWARWTETVLSSLQVILLVIRSMGAPRTGGFPSIVPPQFGMLIIGYILYLLLSQKGSVIFSPAYKEVIARTPHIKYRTSLILKVALVFFVSVIGLAILGAILSRR